MNVSSHKRLREEMVLSKANDVFYQTVVFSEWFLTKLLDYLNMREIVSLDSAICNKSDRVYWLKCIAKNVGSVSNKVHGYVTDIAQREKYNSNVWIWNHWEIVQIRNTLLDLESVRSVS